MRVVHVSAECAPFAKTGGLGDVAAALPVAQSALGHDVLTVLPLYRRAARTLADLGLPLAAGPELTLPLAGGLRARTWTTEHRGTTRLFVEHPVFDRDGLYGYGDEDLRFALMTVAALEVSGAVLGGPVDVFHAHDWHAGLLPHYLPRYRRAHPTARSVFTIHNLAYQGLFGAEAIGRLCLDGRDHHVEGFEFHGGVSFMKAGINQADAVTTVSPRYAKEICTPEHGFRLDGLLRRHHAKLHGIVNGLDTEVWDPATDPAIAKRYRAHTWPSGKAANRAALLAEMGLPEQDALVVGVVSRLTAQKGLDLLADLVPALHGLRVQVALLGSGDPDLEARFRGLARVFSHNLAVRVGFDEGLAHRIVAGSDALAVPSRFEPCGLTQLQAMRYGTIPVVHATGGLADTVKHLDTGVVFEHPTPTGLHWALGVASRRRRDADEWKAMARRGMAQDLSWERSARSYDQLYGSLAS